MCRSQMPPLFDGITLHKSGIPKIFLRSHLFITFKQLLMPTLNPYFTFNGNCREAMSFYKECLGGELSFMIVKDSPVADQMPPQFKDQILHSSLKTGELEIMASDMQPEKISDGNAVHMCLNCKSEEEQEACLTNYLPAAV